MRWLSVDDALDLTCEENVRETIRRADDRYIEHYRLLSAQARACYEGSESAAGRARFEHEWDNLRAAVGWAVDRRDTEAASAIVEAAFWFAYWSLKHEHAEWTDRVVALPDAGVAVHGSAGMWALLRGRVDEAARLGHLGIAKAPSLEHSGTAVCWLAVATGQWMFGEPSVVQPALVHGIGAATAACSPYEIAVLEGAAAIELGTIDGVAATAGHERAHRVAGPLHNAPLDAYVNSGSSYLFIVRRQFDEAMRWIDAASSAAAVGGNRYVAGAAAMNAALVARRSGRPALPAHERSLQRLYADRDWLNIWSVLESLAALLAARGSVEAAAVLIGHVDGHGLGFRPRPRRLEAALATIIANRDASRWMARGAELDRHELVEYALAAIEASRQVGDEVETDDFAPAAASVWHGDAHAGAPRRRPRLRRPRPAADR